MIDIKSIAATYDPRAVIAKLGLEGEARGTRFWALNPTRSDAQIGSFYIDLNTGYFADKSTSDWGTDIVALWAYCRGMTQGAAAAALRDAMAGSELAAPVERVGAVRRWGAIIMPAIVNSQDRFPTSLYPGNDLPSQWDRHYIYSGVDGISVLGNVYRWDLHDGSKEIRQRFMFLSEGGTPTWRWSGPTGDDARPLYRLERLKPRPKSVWIVEGEKTCDAAQLLAPEGVSVLSWLGGCVAAGRVDVGHLRGLDCVLIPDRDAQRDKKTGKLFPYAKQPGIVAMNEIATKLQAIGSRVSIVDYTPGESKHGWDLADAAAEGLTPEQVQEMVRANARELQTKKAVVAATPAKFGESELYTPMPLASFHGTDTKNKPWDAWLTYVDMLKSYGISCRENEMSQRIELLHVKSGRLMMQEEILTLASYNQIPKNHWREHMRVISSLDSYHPVVDWIKSKPWDGRSRIADIFGTLTIGDSDPELSFRLFWRWAVSAIALVMQERLDVNGAPPAAQGALVLVGSQNLNKSRWLLSLGPAGAVRTGVALDVDNKDALIRLTTTWLVECAELSGSWGSNKPKQDRTKAHMTNNMEFIRKPYAPEAIERPRRTVYIGTENNDKFLTDPTGNRRWWIVRVVGMQVDHGIDIQQFWAEVYSVYRDGEPWWLVGAERDGLNESNKKHEVESEIDSRLEGDIDWESQEPRRWTTASSLLANVGIMNATPLQCRQAIAYLRDAMGCDVRENGKRATKVLVPRRL